MNRQRFSMRSRGSSSSAGNKNRGQRIKDWCRKVVAFMCTQVGVGGLIVAYALIGAVSFISIETQEQNDQVEYVANLRKNYASELWNLTDKYNIFNKTQWRTETNIILQNLQNDLVGTIKTKGYDGRTQTEIWSFPAALMFCLSIFTMIGYGNMVPKTSLGKGATVIYATFGIPLYVLYFLNMGKVFAQTFKWLYTALHECSGERNDDYRLEDGETRARKVIIVPSTACLWVIIFYILTGTIMFAEWEKWDYLDSVYFCVTSLCKIGMGDFIPGANKLDSNSSKQTKFAVNFVYLLLGMGLVAMCYNLMREDVRVKMQEIKEDLRLCLEDLRSRFARCCGEKNIDEYK